MTPLAAGAVRVNVAAKHGTRQRDTGKRPEREDASQTCSRSRRKIRSCEHAASVLRYRCAQLLLGDPAAPLTDEAGRKAFQEAIVHRIKLFQPKYLCRLEVLARAFPSLSTTVRSLTCNKHCVSVKKPTYSRFIECISADFFSVKHNAIQSELGTNY